MKGLRRNLPFPTVKNKNNSYLIMLKNNDKVSKKGFETCCDQARQL